MRTVALLMALAACGDPGSEGAVRRALDGMDPADLTKADPLDWVGVSTPWLFTTGVFYAPSWSEEVPSCFEAETDGDVTTWRAVGDCEEDGVRYFGEVVQDAEGVRYHGIGSESEECGGWAGGRLDGSYAGPERPAEGAHAFSITLRTESWGDAGDDCASTEGETAMVYEGTVEWFGEDLTGDGVGDDQVFDGSGEYGSTRFGRAEIETREEVVAGSVCQSEAASGTTEITSAGHALGLEYDGATDCDGEGTAHWTLDGEDQGEISGVYCSHGPGGRVSLAGLLLATALAGRRRRGR